MAQRSFPLMRDFNQSDYDDPRAILEREESETETINSTIDFVSMISRLIAWQVEGKKLHSIGMRTLVICHTIRPDIIAGMTLDQIAQRCGYGRSAVHKLSKDFRDNFHFHGTQIHERSQEVRAKLSRAWHKTHETPQSAATFQA
jgi:AraC-like DNA-binding protein